MFALRWNHFDLRIPNTIVLYKNSGVLDGELIDQDDVNMIGNTGLNRSLVNMRTWHTANP